MTAATILIADDDPQIREALRMRLCNSDYKVITCRDGLDAIARCKGHSVDAVILDHQMPMGEGRSVAHNIRQYTDAPIIFFSGCSRDDFVDTVMQLDNAYYMPKPLESKRLIALLQQVVPKKAHAC